MVVGSYILIITLKVNGLNAPTQRPRLAGWMKTCACMLSQLPHHSAWSRPPLYILYTFLQLFLQFLYNFIQLFCVGLFLLLCFLPREVPLGFVVNLVWRCWIPLTFACLESFWFLHQNWMRVFIGRVFLVVGSSLSSL